MSFAKFWWALGVAIVLAALVVCLLPGSEIPGTPNDKVEHLAGHGLMALYFAGLVPRGRWWAIFAFLLVFGVVVELAQHYMALGRHGDVRDVIANVLGALLGLLLARLGLSRWPQAAAWLLGQRRATE